MFGLLIKQRLYRSSGVTFPQAVHIQTLSYCAVSSQVVVSCMKILFRWVLALVVDNVHLTVTLHHNIVGIV